MGGPLAYLDPLSTALYDPIVATSLTEHRITHKLKNATSELADYGFTSIPQLAPLDADAFDAGLREWARDKGVEIHIGLHGGGVFARVRPQP